MTKNEKIQAAFDLFDTENRKDPNLEIYQGVSFPKELLYAQRLSDELSLFEPSASTALKLAARSQHICRWEIPRSAYEQNKVGYLKWRQDLKKFHADKATIILNKIGFDQETIDDVRFLLLKKQLKKNLDTQTLEDVICLVFLKYYFEAFAKKHQENEEKLINILQKTWKKMSKKGHTAALLIDFSDATSSNIIKKALDL